ncbi:peptide/nickel transport system substrate-binding protein [Halogranum amylolyticum]|uniref:Peptide/nickel transport system substrate-binding protein n=1 Tax=Halogranum amylolyticum TaxID=660520 RepID=A0A1H8UYD1_9EURY|nr:ABC transporter substrate-binding protein [Halogranum amylolyticum]SEP07578.1 peptide/nickel transport system substrate-binding protein [Halogranum amylolyticum]
MMDNDNGSGNRSPLSRRRFVQALGATGVTAGFAGCGGQQAVETTGSSSDGNAENAASDTATPAPVDSETKRKIQELAYVTNQTLPVLPLQEKLAQSFQTTDDWSVPSKDSPNMQLYWPTEWLPRTGAWSQSDGANDSKLTLAQWAVPQDSQYNPWNGKNFAEPRRMLFDRFMRYNLAKQKYEPYLIADYSLDGETMTLSVREDQTWHNGDQVTATDVANQIKLDIYNGGSLGQFVAPEDKGKVSERVTTVDDSTVELSLTMAANEEVLLAYLQPKYLVAHESTYGEYVQRFDDAESDDARSKVLGDLTSETVPEPVGCGPFQFENADTQRTLLTKYEEHPDAGQIDFPEAEYLYMPSNQKRWNALINEQTDGSATLFMPSNKLNQLPDSVQVSLIPRHWGLGLVFNFEKEPVDDPRVRKAIAHVINRESVAKNSGAGTNSKIAVTYPSGLTGEFNGQIEGHWLEGVADKFETYGTNKSQTDKAAALLEEAGYQKQGGTWKKNGKALSIPIKGPAGFSDWVSGAQTVVSQLQQFGIEAEAIMKDTSTYWGKDYSNGDFVVGLQGWASYDQAYPYFHFKWIFDSWDAKNAWNLSSEFETPVLHEKVRDSKTVTPAEIVSELATSQ